MWQSIINIDTAVTLFFNSYHSPTFDFIMLWVSNRFVWVPLYLLLLFFVIKQWKKKSILLIVLLLLTVTISDQSCNLLKKSTKRLRPSHNVELIDKIHLVEKPDGELYRGGKYSFPSSHAANAMVLAVFTFFFVGKRKMWVLISMFSWAALLGYSRIYLGVHYWLDIEMGYFVGFVCFLIIFGYLLFQKKLGCGRKL